MATNNVGIKQVLAQVAEIAQMQKEQSRMFALLQKAQFAKANVQRARVAFEVEDSDDDESDDEEIVEMRVAKVAKKAVNPYFAYRHSAQAKIDSKKNRSMSAAIRARTASAKQVAQFVATKSGKKRADGSSSRGQWIAFAKQYGYARFA